MNLVFDSYPRPPTSSANIVSPAILFVNAGSFQKIVRCKLILPPLPNLSSLSQGTIGPGHLILLFEACE